MTTQTAAPTRTETDSLGSREVPADVYWGIHTARALENFPISQRPISVYPDLVTALALVKQAAARVADVATKAGTDLADVAKDAVQHAGPDDVSSADAKPQATPSTPASAPPQDGLHTPSIVVPPKV